MQEMNASYNRGFFQLSKAWNGFPQIDKNKLHEELLIGLYDSEGNTTGQFKVRWTLLEGKVFPKFSAWNDGWKALSHFQDMLSSMEDIKYKYCTPEEFCKMLISHGIKDMTPATKS
ncbi:MAG: hypothetical protein QM500_04970 [Methylococcales bacterium]